MSGGYGGELRGDIGRGVLGEWWVRGWIEGGHREGVVG